MLCYPGTPSPGPTTWHVDRIVMQRAEVTRGGGIVLFPVEERGEWLLGREPARISGEL